MDVIKTVREMRAFSNAARLKGKTIGFVPTMGFLHKGHLSLVKKARAECEVVVVSIFVNPTQFAPNEDLKAYPRDFERDKELCEKENADAIFFPSTGEMYSKPLTFVEVEELGKVLCGKTRPSHFRGVTTVVSKLFNIAKPTHAYFGLKDFQQFVIVKKMVDDLNFDLELVGCPIVREEDGLAMSSRNKYLSKEERKKAPVLNKALSLAQEMFSRGETNPANVRQAVIDRLSETGCKIDYVKLFETESLKPVEKIGSGNAIALAVFFEKARLIDNRVFE